jgi:chemotaxis protein MotB
MANKPKPQEEEGGEGAPLWIISFADMISLLMAFFVMLSTFSNFGPAEAAKLKKVAKSALAPNYYGGWHVKPPRTAVGPKSVTSGQNEKGSEKPTLDQGSGKGLLAESGQKDFRTRKVFLIESATVFLGTGTALSADGRDFLEALAAYLEKLPDRIIVSENPSSASGETGLMRAISIVDYLAAKGLSKNRCGVAAAGLSPQNSPDAYRNGRMLEISLIDEGAYK